MDARPPRPVAPGSEPPRARLEGTKVDPKVPAEPSAPGSRPGCAVAQGQPGIDGAHLGAERVGESTAVADRPGSDARFDGRHARRDTRDGIHGPQCRPPLTDHDPARRPVPVPGPEPLPSNRVVGSSFPHRGGHPHRHHHHRSAHQGVGRGGSGRRTHDRAAADARVRPALQQRLLVRHRAGSWSSDRHRGDRDVGLPGRPTVADHRDAPPRALRRDPRWRHRQPDRPARAGRERLPHRFGDRLRRRELVRGLQRRRHLRRLRSHRVRDLGRRRSRRRRARGRRPTGSDPIRARRTRSSRARPSSRRADRR